MSVQTEYPFTLPRGYIDNEGVVHREGVMRLANAMDEIEPLRDHRVQKNSGYLAVIMLSRVVTRIGKLPQVYPSVIESLTVADFSFLQAMYRRVNYDGYDRVAVSCPQCTHKFEVEPGESPPGEH